MMSDSYMPFVIKVRLFFGVFEHFCLHFIDPLTIIVTKSWGIVQIVQTIQTEIPKFRFTELGSNLANSLQINIHNFKHCKNNMLLSFIKLKANYFVTFRFSVSTLYVLTERNIYFMFKDPQGLEFVLLKVNMNSDILLQTTAIFFYRTIILNRVFARCIPRLISFTWASSSCKKRKQDLRNLKKNLAHSGTRTHDPRIVKTTIVTVWPWDLIHRRQV